MRISDEEKQNEGFEREIETFRAINHPNLLELFEVIYDEDRVHLVTEYMNVASLINLVNRLPMGRFTEADAKFIMTQVVRGVEHLHQRNIAHLDIKLDNIFVRIKNQGYVFKLGDFDCSQLGENVVIRSGTPCYLSPEVFIEHGVGISGKQCDMWALGVSLFLMINGTLPFDGATPLDIAQRIVNGHIKWSHNEVKISLDAKCLILALLKFDPNDRLTASEFLKHKWFDDSDLKIRLGRLNEILSQQSPDKLTQKSNKAISKKVRRATQY